MENKIGSTWKKWNLHIHTDASDGKDPVKKYKMRLLAKYIKCIAVTDHHTVVNVDMITLAALQGCVILLWCLLCTLLKKRILMFAILISWQL